MDRGIHGSANTRTASPRRQRTSRGVTLIELLVVVGIAATFTAMLFAAYQRFQSGYRASTALTRVESALHYARNLAIANNRVYHVRFENVFTDPTIGSVNTPTGIYQTPPLKSPPQSIAIYCFPELSDALKVTDESVQLGSAPVLWNPKNVVLSAPTVAWSGTASYKVGDTVTYNALNYACISNVDTSNGGIAVTPDTVVPAGGNAYWRVMNNTYYNYLVERIDLPLETFYGIQYKSVANPGVQPLLYFKPDGTMCYKGESTNPSSLTLFVTDHVGFAEDRTMPEQIQSDTRKDFYNTHKLPTKLKSKGTPYMKMIQIFQGGMIKVRPLLTPSGAPNPL